MDVASFRFQHSLPLFAEELEAISFQICPRVFIFLYLALLLSFPPPPARPLSRSLSRVLSISKWFPSCLFRFNSSCIQLTASAFPLRRIHFIRVRLLLFSSSFLAELCASSSWSRTGFSVSHISSFHFPRLRIRLFLLSTRLGILEPSVFPSGTNVA